ncbi:hypothetical protein F4779DRAFT_113912 [Xylariaceae sp. FL0662B]|nr:hypothetical protein F4779DRAFT_113912 [Xylariaceae sp. FL0662B]
MRTRKQARSRQEKVEPTPPPPSPSLPSPPSLTSPTTPTVVTITKIEGPTAAPSNRETPSKLPKPLQFPLVLLLSLALSALGFELTRPWTKGQLTAHVRLLRTWSEVLLVTGWRIFELGLGWYGSYDVYDLTALNLLSHGPPLYLLYAFYETPASALLLTLAIEIVATYVPFRLLRPLSTAHSAPGTVPNAEIVTDRPIALLTTLLAGAIYSVTLFFAYATYLPRFLVVYFNGLPSIASAHETTYVGLLPVTLVLGFAARAFIFTPVEATGRTPADARNEAFDPVRASLAETVRWNVWGWPAQTKVAMQRTALLVLVTGVNTFLQTRLTIQGVETAGAAAWGSVWVLASAITGLGLGAVGSG